MGLGQLFEIKPRCCRGSLLRDELGLRQFETRNDLTYSFPRAPAGALGRLGSPNLAQAGRYFRGNLWHSAIGRKVMRIVHKPVALAWRQRASSALRARAAATLPPAFMNNSHDFCPTRHGEKFSPGTPAPSSASAQNKNGNSETRLKNASIHRTDPFFFSFSPDTFLNVISDFSQGLAFTLKAADELGATDHFRSE